MTRLPMRLLLTPVASLIAANPALAQTATDVPALQRVEVTSSKRSQIVLDVPYAVTAIGGAEIQDRGATDLKQMQSVVPSLFITENAPGASRIQLRGLSQGQGYGPSLVGAYLDEISINQTDAQRSLDVPLVDMQRIEVLRGPQGTLYGDGSMGGTIRFITKSPKLNATEFSAEGALTGLKQGGTGGRFHAVANLPLAQDVAAARLVVGHEDIPGWVDNTVNGQKDINGAKRDYLRAKVLVQPNSKLDVSLMVFHTRTDSSNQSSSKADNTIAAYIPSPTKDQADLANLVVTADFAAVRLVSSSGYLERKLDTSAELTPVYRAAFPPSLLSLLLPKPTSGGAYRQNMNMKILTQELRLESDDRGPLAWTAGGYYRKTKTNSVTSDVWTDANTRVQGGYDGTAPTDVEQIALFGELTYALAQQWSVTGGLRSFREKAALVGSKLPSGLTPPNTPTTVYDDHQTFKATTPRLNLLWRYSPQASAYATVSKGFRSGGFNATVTPRTYGPEDIVNYEVGNKGSLIDNRLQYEVALYYSKYNNVQAQDLAPGCTAATCRATTVNTGQAAGSGLDFTVSTLLAKGLTMDASFGVNNLAYTITTKERNEGDPLNYVPKRTAALSLNYRFAWAAGLPGMARLDLQHADAVRVILRSQAIDIRSSATNLVNARIGLEMPRWQVYLEGKNLNNFNGVTNPGTSGLPDVRAVPRSLGVVGRVQF